LTFRFIWKSTRAKKLKLTWRTSRQPKTRRLRKMTRRKLRKMTGRRFRKMTRRSIRLLILRKSKQPTRTTLKMMTRSTLRRMTTLMRRSMIRRRSGRRGSTASGNMSTIRRHFGEGIPLRLRRTSMMSFMILSRNLQSRKQSPTLTSKPKEKLISRLCCSSLTDLATTPMMSMKLR